MKTAATHQHGTYRPPTAPTTTPPPVRLGRDIPLVIIALVMYVVIVVMCVIGVTFGWMKHPYDRP